MNLRVGAAQFPVGGDPAANADEVCSLMDALEREGVRLVVFPESATLGVRARGFPDLATRLGGPRPGHRAGP